MNLRSKLRAGSYLAKTYITALPRIVYRSTLSLFLDSKGTQQFIHQVLNAQDLESDDPVLGSTEITHLKGGDMPDVLKICPYYYRPSTSEVRLLLEVAILAYIMQVLRPQIVFEIGTFIGRTTRLLAINSPKTTKIFTLDLFPEQVKHKIGEEFRGTPESERIIQLYGDSRTFDFSPWYNKCDFVWVDGCHNYEYVVSDTNNALKLRRNGGWIAWHDYRHTAWWSGVTRCVREVARKYPGQVFHLRGTTIAVFKKKDEEA